MLLLGSTEQDACGVSGSGTCFASCAFSRREVFSFATFRSPLIGCEVGCDCWIPEGCLLVACEDGCFKVVVSDRSEGSADPGRTGSAGTGPKLRALALRSDTDRVCDPLSTRRIGRAPVLRSASLGGGILALARCRLSSDGFVDDDRDSAGL